MKTSPVATARAATVAAGLLAVGIAVVPSAAVASPANPTTPILVLDSGAGTIYELDTNNVQTVFATGLNTYAYGGLAHDTAGNVYATSGANIVRFANSGGTGTTVLTASSGEFTDVAVDGLDNLYAFNDATQQITELSPSGTRTTVASSGYYSLAVDAVGRAYTADNTAIYTYPVAGRQESVFTPRGAYALDVAGDGTLWAADSGPNLQSFNSAGVVTASAALPGAPLGIGADGHGNVFLALFDSTNNFASSVYERFPGTSRASFIRSGYVGAADVMPVPTARTPTPTSPTGTTTNGLAFSLTNQRAKNNGNQRNRRLEVTATGLSPGEHYRLVLGKRVLARGTASGTSSVTRTVALPRCLGGSHRIRLVGSTHSGWTRFHISRVWPQRCTGLWAH